MQSQVRKIEPRIQPFSEAVAAYRGAKPAECLTLLRGHYGVQANFLRARAALRVGDPTLGAEALGAIDDKQLLLNRERAELLTLRAAVQTRLRDFDSARETLDHARVLAFGSASAALEAEYQYYDALWYFGMKRFEEADRASEAVLNVVPASFDAGGYFVPQALSRGRALILRGLICVARERYCDQAAYNRAAIAELQLADSDDLWVLASFLMHLAFGVRDFDFVNDAATLRDAIANAKAWPHELAPMLFEIHCALGWSNALRGDHLNAFREFRTMTELASTPVSKVYASVERAYLTRELGEMHSAREEIEHASKLADLVDWNNVGEQRLGLALLAQEMASYDRHRATRLFERYRELKAKLPPHGLSHIDRRVRAFEFLAEGTVLRANDSIPAAVQRFTKAFEIWDELGYHWRAATAALPVAEILKRQKFVEYVRREAALRPNSWLARRAEKLADEERVSYDGAGRLGNLRLVRS